MNDIFNIDYNRFYNFIESTINKQIEQRVEQKVNEILLAKQIQDESDLISIEKAAARLGISKQTMYKYINAGVYTNYIVVGKVKKFKSSTIDAIVLDKQKRRLNYAST